MTKNVKRNLISASSSSVFADASSISARDVSQFVSSRYVLFFRFV